MNRRDIAEFIVTFFTFLCAWFAVGGDPPIMDSRTIDRIFRTIMFAFAATGFAGLMIVANR